MGRWVGILLFRVRDGISLLSSVLFFSLGQMLRVVGCFPMLRWEDIAHRLRDMTLMGSDELLSDGVEGFQHPALLFSFSPKQGRISTSR